ncbi:MAG: CpsD/CapB family tyrosine-protein kinase [Ruminococcus sp.]|nr:CpsD/CapB family tyrosine-protein kinase [Ruminococcus sp.]
MKNNSYFLISENSPFAIKESYIKLRTNLMFSLCADGKNPCKVFALTSPNASEGKSTTAANIAISFAMLGKKTLIIDTDMRKPKQNRLWDIKAKTGLSDLLAQVNPCEVFEIKDLPLSVICAGNTPPNPSELISSANMSGLLKAVKGMFDYVIIDTPPINTVADAQIISRLVDGTILLVRSGKTKKNDVMFALNSLKQANGNLSGIVLNDIDLKSSKYSYKYNYYKKYSYNYEDYN